ncbi:MAG: hypothetical protein Q8M26_08490 [Pseudolabrys sp.]|nr:hypothetical protein [Pseudolabrys sp.]
MKPFVFGARRWYSANILASSTVVPLATLSRMSSTFCRSFFGASSPQQVYAGDQPLLPYQSGVALPPIKSEVGDNHLPLKMRHEEKAEHERIEVTQLRPIYPRQNY